MKRIGLSLAVLLIIIATSNVQAAEVPPAPDEEGVSVSYTHLTLPTIYSV